MPMSKKHYEADAAAINTVLWTPHADPATVALVISALADVRQQDNPRFDRARFYEACLKNSDVSNGGYAAYKAERDRLGL